MGAVSSASAHRTSGAIAAVSDTGHVAAEVAITRAIAVTRISTMSRSYGIHVRMVMMWVMVVVVEAWGITPVGIIIRIPIPIIAVPVGTVTPADIIAWIVVPIERVVVVGVDVVGVAAASVVVVIIAH